MITSSGNARVKEVISLIGKTKERRRQKLFIVEGSKMFKELPKEHLKSVFLSESFLSQLREQNKDPEEFLDGFHPEIVSDEVMKYMSDTQTPQGILAVAEQFSYTFEDVFPGRGVNGGNDLKAAHLIILETLQDPGNLGTILRAGEGAGVTGIVMNYSTTDIYSPKVIRSTMGSIYRVPFVYAEDLEEAINRIKRENIRL